VPARTRSPAEPIVELDDVLRDALGHLLSAETRYAPVVDAQGRMAGVLSLDAIAHALHVPAEDVPSSTELVAE
jgi:predicted transcriptional regulator